MRLPTKLLNYLAVCDRADLSRLATCLTLVVGLVTGSLCFLLGYEGDQVFRACLDRGGCRDLVLAIAAATLILGSLAVGQVLVPLLVARTAEHHLESRFRELYGAFRREQNTGSAAQQERQ